MSVFRIEARNSAGESQKQGTAWQLDDRRIVTAFHCVGDSGRWLDEISEGAAYVLVDAPGGPKAATPIDFDPVADIALLQVEEPLATRPLPLSDRPARRGDAWYARGFPRSLIEEFPMTGKVAYVRAVGRDNDLHLTCDQGTFESWEGASGSPILIQDLVVGVLTEERPNRNTLTAATIAPLRELLRREGIEHRPEGQAAGELAATVAMTRADTELLDRLHPPAVEDLAVSSYLRDQPRIDDEAGPWLIAWAAARGLHQVIGRLLKLGCRPDDRVDGSPVLFDIREHEIPFFWPGGTALHMAARRGSLPAIRRLVQGGASIDARDRRGSTPLHLAAELREDPFRHLLLRAMDHERKFGELRPEDRNEDALQAVRYLLSQGADPAAVDGGGRTTTEIAADFPEMLGLILERTNAGAQPALREAVYSLNRASVDLLIAHGADLNRPDAEGNLLLHRAIHRFDDMPDARFQECVCLLVEHLLERGADPRLVDSRGETALHGAAGVDSHRITELLLHHRADPDVQRGDDGATPLFLARSAEVARLLLSAGAKPTSVDSQGFRAIDYASIFDRTDILAEMEGRDVPLSEWTPALRSIRAGEDLSAFSAIDEAGWSSARDPYGNPIAFWAIRALNPKALRFLLDRGVRVDERDGEMRTLLAESLRHSGWFSGGGDALREIVALLRERGAAPHDDGRGHPCFFSGIGWWRDELIAPWIIDDADHESRNEGGETLLMLAATWGTPAQVQRILRRGADVDATDRIGRSALFRCAVDYDVDEGAIKANLLVQHGAELNIRDADGSTPLMAAATIGNAMMSRWLLDNGAEKGLRDHSGQSAFDRAIRSTRSSDLINMLRT